MRTVHILICCFLLTAPVMAASGPVRYEFKGQAFEGYYLSPGGKAPLVLLVHDWDGLTAYEQKRAEMLLALGYAVFAVDLFGAGIRPTETKEKKEMTTTLYQDRSRMRDLLKAGMEAAAEQGADLSNAVAMGYCFGGAAVLEWARSGVDLKGFASFHGGLETPQGQDYKLTRGGILVLHGTADTSVTMQHFADLAARLEAQGVAHEMITYSGAPHAFTVFNTERYREEADKQSWKRFVDFLGQTLR